VHGSKGDLGTIKRKAEWLLMTRENQDRNVRLAKRIGRVLENNSPRNFGVGMNDNIKIYTNSYSNGDESVCFERRNQKLVFIDAICVK
jgi:hypothetical protein